ncbi:hypothetical protein [Streptomyces sp. NPDC058872]|uniref:hypothetical protein n=1 Tax=Streptomyces sp. NPDC058872 TaxID=3346661 RepID=UPI00368BE612
MTHDPDGGWSFTTAREPASFGAGQLTGEPGVDHAMGESGTLCGIPEHQVTRYMHLFEPAEPEACPDCRQRAEAAPTKPCAQERLHNRLQAADPGQARDDLLAALRKGAKVRLWIRGPAANLARHYARLNSLTDGAEPAVEAFNTARSIGLARVEDDDWGYLAVLPEDDSRPLVARGPRTLS